jgi:acyl-CoA thioester hydrolase
VGVGRRYEASVPVRWSDLDAFGHVNNARTLTLLEEARVDWLFVDAAAKGVERLSRGVVVADVHATYHAPIGHGRPVTVSMAIVQLRAADFVVDYVVTAGEDLAVTATTRIVAVDETTFRPRRLEPAERSFLQQYLGAAR